MTKSSRGGSKQCVNQRQLDLTFLQPQRDNKQHPEALQLYRLIDSGKAIKRKMDTIGAPTCRILRRTTSSDAGSVTSNLHPVTASTMKCMTSAAPAVFSSEQHHTICGCQSAIYQTFQALRKTSPSVDERQSLWYPCELVVRKRCFQLEAQTSVLHTESYLQQAKQKCCNPKATDASQREMKRVRVAHRRSHSSGPCTLRRVRPP